MSLENLTALALALILMIGFFMAVGSPECENRNPWVVAMGLVMVFISLVDYVVFVSTLE